MVATQPIQFRKTEKINQSEEYKRSLKMLEHIINTTKNTKC